MTVKEQPPQLETVECPDCASSGVYHGAGRVENGRFIGFVGHCFRCRGTGFQTAEDQRRNWGYDMFHRHIRP